MFKKDLSTEGRSKSSRPKDGTRKKTGDKNGSAFQSMIQTRSIERVLAPIAAQVSQLIILNETAERQGGKLPNLIPFAQTVLRATEDLVQVGHKLVRDTDDEKLQREMPEVCDATIASGRSMLMAVQRLQAEPHSEPARDNMVTAARRLLETTMKVLLISDDAEVRRISSACQWVLEGLQTIRAVGSMKELVTSFKEFSESVFLLCDLCDKRQQDLTSPEKKEKILTGLNALKKTMPLLSSSMQTFVKYPNNVQTKASRDYACKHVSDAVAQIQEAVQQNASSVQDVRESRKDQPGQFAHNLEKLIELLSPNLRLKLDEGFDGILESVVRHGMSVAAASRDIIREDIVHVCKKILNLRSEVMDHHQAVIENPAFGQLDSDFEESCENLAHDLLTLEDLVKSALIHQVVDVLTETTEPLDRLVKAATVRLKEKGPIKEQLCIKLLQPLDDTFHDHSDRLLQMASFIAASCIDQNRGRQILSIMTNLEDLDPDVFPSCLAVRQNLTNKGALEHLKLVRREWCSCIQQLVDIVDELINTRKFLEISESCIEKDIDECRQAAMVSDPDLLADAANNILGRCKRILHVAKQHQDRSEDAVYRNGLQVFIGQLENAIPLVKNGAHYVVGNIDNKRALSSLSEHNHHLLNCVHKLCNGLNSSNHPDIVSPLRQGVRGRSAQQSVDSMAEFSDYSDTTQDPVKMLQTDTSQRHHSRLGHDEDYLSKSVKYLSLLDATPSFKLANHASSTPQSASFKLPNQRSSRISLVVDQGDDGPKPVKKITKDMIHKLEMAYPMNDLVRALFSNQRDRVGSLCQMTTAKVESYHPLMERMKKLNLNMETIGSIESKMLTITQLTSDLTNQFQTSLEGSDSDKAEALIKAEKWSSHVGEFVSEMKDLIGFWAKIFTMATDMDGLQSQLDNVTSCKEDMLRLVSVTIALKETLQSLEAEDTPTHAMHIQQMRSKAADWTKLTNSLHSLANELAINADDRVLVDKVEQLVLDWSLSSLELVAILDHIILAHRSPEVISMATAIRSGHEDEVMSEVKRLNVKCKELKDQSTKALVGCSDASQQLNLTQAMKDLENSTNSLATMSISSASGSKGQRSLKDEFQLQRISLLQREWLVKVQMVECMIDNLIIEMLVPLDRLTGTALAAKQSQGPSKQQIMSEFLIQAEGLSAAVSKLRQDCATLLQGVSNLPERTIILQSIDALCRTTPSVVSELRCIADNTATPTDELTSLKREWACNAKAVVCNLDSLPGVDPGVKQAMTIPLFQDHTRPSHPGLGPSFPINQSFSYATQTSPRVGASAMFTPLTVPQLTPEQWRLIQTLPQQGIPLIQTPPASTSPYHHGNQHHLVSGTTTPNPHYSMMTPRIIEPTLSPKQSPPIPHELSPGRLRSLHHSFHARRDPLTSESSRPRRTSPSNEAGQAEGNQGAEGPFRSRTLGLADLPKSLKLKSASTSSLQSVSSVGPSESGSVRYSNSITAAALALQQETDRWEEEKNDIIKVAKTMAKQMTQMAKYAHRKACNMDKEDLINTAKAIAANGMVIVKFANIIARNCLDKRFAKELEYQAQHIPTFSTQLNIIASVKAATPDDLTSNVVLVKNAENLMEAVVKTLKAAEAACVKGLQSIQTNDPSHDPEEQEATALAMQWKRKLHRHRLIEASIEDTDHLGLRKIKKNVSAPSLTEIVMSR